MVAVSNRATVAVLNNSAEIVEMLQMALQDEGYHTVGATLPEFRDGRQSLLSFLDECNPWLIIFDVSPPYPETWERFQVVQEAESFRGRRVILTTTDKPALEALIGPTYSFEVFSKPFELEDLLAAVQRHMHDCKD